MPYIETCALELQFTEILNRKSSILRTFWTPMFKTLKISILFACWSWREKIQRISSNYCSQLPLKYVLGNVFNFCTKTGPCKYCLTVPLQDSIYMHPWQDIVTRFSVVWSDLSLPVFFILFFLMLTWLNCLRWFSIYSLIKNYLLMEISFTELFNWIVCTVHLIVVSSLVIIQLDFTKQWRVSSGKRLLSL